LPFVVIVCAVVFVETKLTVPLPVRVIVAVEPIDRATLPVPRVASPIDSVDVVAAKTRVPPFATVNDLQTTEIDAGIVTVTPLGIVISSAAVVATPLKAVDEAAVECQFPVTAVRFAISNP
jgi:hypothetical protein